MRKLLIISPHYPPSYLAAVHRTRLFAQHLPEFGWEPIILTVNEKYYEESLDWDLHKLIPKTQKIFKVNAMNVSRPRILGDIGLRAFFQLRKRALQLIKSEKIDFVFIPIPSFYTSLIGPYLYKKTGVKYGIDYIDPWVHTFPGSDRLFSRHWFSTQLAKLLEPIAVKHASLITGVSEGYYAPVLERNTHLKNQTIATAMPYGGEEGDHTFVRNGTRHKAQGTSVLLLSKSDGTFRFVYAGAMLPKAYKPLEEICKALANLQLLKLPQPLQRVEFHFIGTLGTIKPIAQKYGLFDNVVFEYPNRIPYLDVLKNLEATDGVFILGSTEPHYTPSKVYQGVLSQKPILAILHQESTAVKVLQESKAGQCVLMDGENDLDTLGERFIQQLTDYLAWANAFDPNKVNKDAFEQYSATAVTKQLVNNLNKIKFG